MTLRNELTDHEDFINSPDGQDSYIAPAIMDGYKAKPVQALATRTKVNFSILRSKYTHALTPIAVTAAATTILFGGYEVIKAIVSLF
ncbi:hypothetical protein [Diaphorobacter aerolatus]|uniref:Uncharacterized protein n=1 Tax=Diaphorobacter aerolatus TaxID=1288495 RepID=A0A7H0GJB2_9BURK|nr:hypothetical protein [Diaphorobacter aerolatus]QNP48378.1 hypothetical protein H9K75_20885 [Diaphorobacter aerolatus]